MSSSGGLHVIYGDDTQAKQQFMQQLINSTGNFKGLNKTVLREDTTPDDIIVAAQTPPFGEGMRCVLVYDFLWEALKKKEVGALLELFKTLPDYTMLVFFRTEKKLPISAQKMLATLFVGAEIAKLEIKTEAEQAQNLAKRFAKNGVKAKADACRELVQRCRADPEAVENEFLKLCAYAEAMGKGEITAQDLALMVGGDLEQDVFRLGKAVVSGDFEYASAALIRLLGQGQQPVMIIGSLRFLFSDLLIAKLACKGNYSPEKVCQDFASTFKGKTFRIKNAMGNAGRFSLDSICGCIFALAEADWTLKTTSQDPKGVLQEALCRLQMSLHSRVRA